MESHGQAAGLGAALSARKASSNKYAKSSRDGRVMDTNNSSIVSKRSVERLYLDKPHFFRYFVKKPIRRSPLINRGYWLRMHAIEQTVLRFLKEPSEKRKIVINLGCGYDPLPFQCLSKYPEHCTGVTFVDIDYPELMIKKRDMVLDQSEMKHLIDEPNDEAPHLHSTGHESPIMIRSNRYMGLGCDLRDIARLDKILEEELQIRRCLVLCSAEVSITYMDVDAADALITWAAQYDDVRFCLLEQLLPDGQEHPFALKMMQHFANLGTPLRCVQRYPLLQDQETRFLRAGFHSVKARTLWNLWQDQSAVASDLRLHLNKVEPFDEWEEFALFSSHYFILEAKKSLAHPLNSKDQEDVIPQDLASESQSHVQESPSIAVDDKLVLNVLSSQSKHHRKFGATIPFSEKAIGIHGGIVDKGRSNSTSLYQDISLEDKDAVYSSPPMGIEARACHTITALDDRRCLLAGGRTSPDNALHDCWLYHSGQWKSVDKLPIPLYRHGATSVGYGTADVGVLIFGGKTTGGIVTKRWFLWKETIGWQEVYPLAEELTPRFGATIASTSPHFGILLGGMGEDGLLCDETWTWNLEYGKDKDSALQLNSVKDFPIAPRFGAHLVWWSGGLFIIGGVSTTLITMEEEILRLSNESFGNVNMSTMLEPTAINIDFGQRPLLVGHATCTAGNALVIAGGGAVCFSFDGEPEPPGRHFVAKVVIPPNCNPVANLHAEDAERDFPEVQSKNMAQAVKRVRLESQADFDQLMLLGQPFVMEGLNLGECMTEWTVDKLVQKINSERLKPFGKFMREISDGSPQYLRSISAKKATEEPACFADDFPSLSHQFHLPQQLETVRQNQHSSPLRISGPVMANVLSQISGQKVLALYPPIDAVHFQIPPGSSSSPMTVFHPNQRGSVSYPRQHIRAVLNEGDVLYIPPLWLHSASPLDNLSVSINVFFRNLRSGYAAGRDVYGNRDLQVYENGRRSIEKIAKSMESLPRDIASTYLVRLGEELTKKGQDLKHKPDWIRTQRSGFD
ncbi:MAG: hypothetical protein Q9215_001111 [Flavoplaca cf. flavocitrina]